MHNSAIEHSTRGVWKVLSICFLGLPRCHTDWIPSEGPHSDWTALFWTTEVSKASNQRKKARKAQNRNPLALRQCTSSTPPWLPWQQFTIVDLKLSPIHLIRQTWPPTTFIFSHKWKKPWLVAIFPVMMRSELKLRSFLSLKQEFYTGITALQHHWSKCSALEGDYVEKYIIINL